MAYYCTTTDVVNRLSQRGYDLRLDDNPQAYPAVLREATNRVNFFCMPIYPAANLQADADAGGFTNDLATTLACYFLCRRRGNTPPAAVGEDYREALEYLDDIRLETKQLPNVEMTTTPYPAFSNVHLVPGYLYRQIRVEVPISEQTVPTGYVQAVDWRSVYFFEY